MLTIADSIEWTTEEVRKLSHEQCCLILTQHGFDRATVPSDWREYYSIEELREFVLGYLYPKAE